jgi:hypothetical protein
MSDESEPTDVALARSELAAAANALNEVLNGPDALEEWEFHARFGASRDDVHALLVRIRDGVDLALIHAPARRVR